VLEALDPKAELLNLADVLSQGPDAVDAWAKTYEAKLKEEAERVEQTARELALAVFESNTANVLWAALMS
jgi:hypothetical protein